MDLEHPLRSLCPDRHGPVLDVLARADEPLTRRQIAQRVGMTDQGPERALDDLAAAGLVWHAKLRSGPILHVLYREHLAAELLIALAHLDELLARRVGEHATAWQPPPEAVALRRACPDPPDGLDPAPPCPAAAERLSTPPAAIDLLVCRPLTDDPTGRDHQPETLAEQIRHWTGNRVHLQVRRRCEPASSHDTAADWWLLTGTAPPGLPTREPATPPEPPTTSTGPGLARSGPATTRASGAVGGGSER